MFKWFRLKPRQEVSQDLTMKELDARAERFAHEAGFPSAEAAFRFLDAGKLEGTLLESELQAIRFLKEGRKLTTA